MFDLHETNTTMANYKKFDPRLDSLVMETTTSWDPETDGLSDEDKQLLSEALHKHPQLASQIHYERSHSGFARHICVTVTDIERLYEEKFAN